VNFRARFVSLAAVAAVAIYTLGGCAQTPNRFFSVILSPAGPLYVAQASSTAISASVLNDTGSGGVTFSISPVGTGTLTQTGPLTATYVAPPNVSASTAVVISAQSVDYPKSSSTLTINVEPPPAITTTTLPSGNIGVAYTGSVVATGGVPPLSWSISGGTLPAGLSLANSTSDTVNITGKPTTNGPSSFTVTVTDAAGETASAPLTIVISTLAITTTSPLPNASFTTPPAPYSEQFAATGGLSPYTWTVASGSTLPAGLSLSPGGLLSGSPTAQGTFTFGITVTDSESTPANVTQSFSLTISGPQNLGLLSGSYAFFFSGNSSTGSAVTTAGTFTADGNGTITTGEQDTNSISASASTNTPNLTGTYTAGTDGRGTISFTNAPTAVTYAFSIDSTGSHGRLIEFDSTGTRGSGRIEKQSVTTCVVSGTASNTYAGNFTFGGTGYASSFSTRGTSLPGPLVAAGTFLATAPISPTTQGSIGSGEDDADIAADSISDAGGSLTGLYNSGTDSTHCVFNLQPSWGNLTYNAYPVSANEAFLVEVDPVSSITPYVSVLDMEAQFGYPFTAQNVIGGPMAGGLSGQMLPTAGPPYIPEVEILQLNPTAAGAFNLLLADNTGGTATTNMQTTNTAANPVSITYSSDQYGRVQATNLTGPISPVLYLVDSTEAFVVSISGNAQLPVIFGHLYGQSTPNPTFTTAYLNGTFVEGSVAPPPSTAARNVSGFFAFDGAGNITGTQDESTVSGNTPSENVAGTYNVLDATNGTGFITLTQPSTFGGIYVIISPTKAVMITATTGDTSPITVVLGN
jgi:Putative Ig domain